MTKKTIPMTGVKSSQIESLGYHPETKTLAVKFLKGAEYRYANVEPAQYDALIKAPSVYSLFNSTIKANPATYPYTKMPPVQTAGETNIPEPKTTPE